MTPIKPVRQGTRDDRRVTALHAGLLFLINHQGNPPDVQQSLLAQLAPDVAQNYYGEATRRLVAIYQGQLKNWPNYWTPPKLPQEIGDLVRQIPANCPGDVDDGGVTATVLNWLVETFRKMASPTPPRGNVRPAAILKKQTS
jgi:hypothetical protein